MTGKSVQIETSGTHEIRAAAGTFVTVSPKIGMPGGFEVLRTAIDRANEIKFPVGKSADIEKLKTMVHGFGVRGKRIYLQPLSLSKSATALCHKEATVNGWLVSHQVHKFVGLK